MNTRHLIFDLETGGLPTTNPAKGPVIFSLGACVFNPFSDDIHKSTFYANIDPESCEQQGMSYELSTMQWWQRQSEEATSALTSNRQPITTVLTDFINWLNEVNPIEYWANSPTFDKVILERAYLNNKMTFPFEFWKENDIRTLKKFYQRILSEPMNITNGTAHNALDDAIKHAKEVQAIHHWVLR